MTDGGVQIHSQSFDEFREYIRSADQPPEGEERLAYVIGDQKQTRDYDDIEHELGFDEDAEPHVIGNVTREVRPNGLLRIGDFVAHADAFRDAEAVFDLVDEQLLGLLALPGSEVRTPHHRVLSASDVCDILDELEAAYGERAVVMGLDFYPDGGHSVGGMGAYCKLGGTWFPADAIANGYESLMQGNKGTLGTLIVPEECFTEEVLEMAHADLDGVSYDVGQEGQADD